MSQKIDGNLPTAAALRSAAVGARVSSAGDDSSTPVSAVAASDSVSLTGQATNLQALQRDLSAAPAVDSSRVQAVKDALTNGSYKINPDAIANRMMDLDNQLGGA
jgi:negative regulator of flagellin synthesis FlgM